ncbi:cell wall-associated hydrolase, invasion-associated protein [Rivularia sp. PCC 7116]|uniref:C40 family peptidase n=1 Tax=Rivularia sp. PCC 7116 TaxID=373994 RepID=UPI00029EC993|nr:NlpC/P60 family protein [Rivularia sp. PCC 7116]AFY54374.1 cell wall-associated hydrolase, invasion-associated protein [Rivularia sp. PCC 7116]
MRLLIDFSFGINKNDADSIKLISPNWKYAFLTLILASCISIKPISMWFDNQLLVQQFRQTHTLKNSKGERVVSNAIAWAGKSYKPGQKERCADFVRFVLRQSNIRVGVTRKPWDAGKQNHNGSLMARSFFGSDIGIILTNPKQFQKGDLIGFTNTYGNFKRGAITHVGIYVGGGKIVDRSTMIAPVRIRNLFSFPNSQIIGVRPHAYQK